MQLILDSIYKETDKLYYEAQSVYNKWLAYVAEREIQRTNHQLDKKNTPTMK